MGVEPDTQLNWIRLGIEGVVIVASILFAFGLQAWWDHRKDAETERQMLIALESELQGALFNHATYDALKIV